MKKIMFTICALLSLTPCLAQKKKIVFVCEHGAAKSVIAAAYFNKMAEENGLAWEAVSRGTSPDDHVSERTKKLLTADSLLDEKLVPQKISQQDVMEADQVVVFFPLPGNIQSNNEVLNWQGIEAVNGDFQRLRDDILKKLNPLVDSLSKQKK